MARRTQSLGFWARIKREAGFVRALLRTLKRVKSVRPESTDLACDDIEAAVDKFRDRPCLICEGKTVTYAEMDAIANRFANWARGRNIKRGDTVALLMPNRIEYLPIWFGLSKVGIATALINTNIQGAALAHSLKISGAAHVILDAETLPAFEAARAAVGRSLTEWVVGGGAARPDRDLDRTLKGVSALRPTRETSRSEMTARDTALYIFTSGTTGMPKAARVTHMRVQLYMRGFAAATESTPEDRIYNVLPLYHATGGLCAMGAALLNGASVVLRKRFSASQFWDDIVRERCTMFVYIGELCRYLVNVPEHPEERSVKLKLAFGNGLRQDVWERMLSRFRIGRILEFYGATEGNVSILNFDGKVGAVGRIPKYVRKKFNVRLVKFDVETEEPMRGANGLCIECRPGEIGEALGKIGNEARTSYTGYADKAASASKILENVFERGDKWFRTGDLLRQDEEGYFFFVDRIGDTYRWKGENVSTTEVSGCLSEVGGVKEANVYGVAVPGYDGRAGMASLVVDDTLDIEKLTAHVEACLPAYAQPIFLRMAPEIETTGTFKYRKLDLVAQGFDPKVIKSPVYFKHPEKGYIPLDAALYRRIAQEKVKL